MNRNRLAKKWSAETATRKVSRRLRRYWADYWRTEIGHSVASVPGRLLPVSKLGRRGRKAGGR